MENGKKWLKNAIDILNSLGLTKSAFRPTKHVIKSIQRDLMNPRECNDPCSVGSGGASYLLRSYDGDLNHGNLEIQIKRWTCHGCRYLYLVTTFSKRDYKLIWAIKTLLREAEETPEIATIWAVESSLGVWIIDLWTRDFIDRTGGNMRFTHCPG